jgi:hypothetical protein
LSIHIYASSPLFTHIVATIRFHPRVTAAKAINNQYSVVHAITTPETGCGGSLRVQTAHHRTPATILPNP